MSSSSPSVSVRQAYNIRIEERKKRRKEQLDRSLASYNKKIDRFQQLVDDRKQLTSSMKMKLLHYLTMHVDEIDIDREYDDMEKIHREMYRDITLEQIERVNDKILKVEKNSERKRGCSVTYLRYIYPNS